MPRVERPVPLRPTASAPIPSTVANASIFAPVLCYHGGYVEEGSERLGEIAAELGG